MNALISAACAALPTHAIATATASRRILKSGNGFQRLTTLRMLDGVELFRRMAELPDLLGEFRHGAKPVGPGMDVRMQPRERIAAERQPGRIHQPGELAKPQQIAPH